jgi:copper chaperone
MTCTGCSGAVTRILTKAAAGGVESFDVNLEEQRVTVTTSTLSQDQVMELIKKSGKPVEPM